MGFTAFKSKSAGLLEYAKTQADELQLTASETVRKLFVPVLSGLMHVAEDEIGGYAGVEKKEYVLEQVAAFYDTVIGPRVNVLLRPLVRKAVLYVTGYLIDSFVNWLKNFASVDALKPFQKA